MDESYYSLTVRIPKLTKRWFRFSLVSLLILVTAVCLLLGLWPQHSNQELHTIQLQRLPAESVADVIKKLLVNDPNLSKSKTVTGDDGSKPSVEVDVDTNTIRFLANEAEVKTIEELLLKLGEAPNPSAPQRELPPKNKFRDISHQQASAR